LILTVSMTTVLGDTRFLPASHMTPARKIPRQSSSQTAGDRCATSWAELPCQSSDLTNASGVMQAKTRTVGTSVQMLRHVFTLIPERRRA